MVAVFQALGVAVAVDLPAVGGLQLFGLHMGIDPVNIPIGDRRIPSTRAIEDVGEDFVGGVRAHLVLDHLPNLDPGRPAFPVDGGFLPAPGDVRTVFGEPAGLYVVADVLVGASLGSQAMLEQLAQRVSLEQFSPHLHDVLGLEHHAGRLAGLEVVAQYAAEESLGHVFAVVLLDQLEDLGPVSAYAARALHPLDIFDKCFWSVRQLWRAVCLIALPQPECRQRVVDLVKIAARHFPVQVSPSTETPALNVAENLLARTRPELLVQGVFYQLRAIDLLLPAIRAVLAAEGPATFLHVDIKVLEARLGIGPEGL